MSNCAKLSLCLPQPRVRPGQQASFEHFKILSADVVRRPDVGAQGHEMRVLSVSGDQRAIDGASYVQAPKHLFETSALLFVD